MSSALTDYVFYWSDLELKPYFIVGQQTLNNTTTSLSIFGKCYPNYGEPLQQNLLYMLENFASPLPPINPTIGQLWYNVSTDKLMIFNVFSQWTTVTSIPTSLPSNPTLGELYWNSSTSTLDYWDGSTWQPIADQQFVLNLINGLQTSNNTQIAGLQSNINSEISARQFQYSQLLNDINTNAQTAASNDSTLQTMIQTEANTRSSEYTNLNALISSLTATVNTNLSTTMGDLQDEINNREAADSSLQQQLSNEINIRAQQVSSIQSNYLPLAGGTMNGNITLVGNPTEPLQPATKQYIDDALYQYTPSVVPFDVTNSYAQINVGPGTWVIYATANYSFNNEWYNWYGYYYGYDYWWIYDYWGGSWWWNNNWWWNNWWGITYGYANINCTLYINGATVDTSLHVNYGNSGSTGDVHLNGTVTLTGPATVTISTLLNGNPNNSFHVAGMALRT